MNILLLGAPGSGKGSQAEKIIEDFAMVQISTGDLLRNALSNSTPDGLKAGEYMSKGELVPDELVLRILGERLERPDCANGVIFDGFPRTVSQAEELDRILMKRGMRLDIVLNIESPFEVLVKRLLSRRVCSKCGRSYNTISNPAAGGKCSSCGGDVVSRPDDREDVIENRLNVYMSSTRPLIEHYAKKGILSSVDGDRSIPEIYSEVKEMIREKGDN